MKEDKKKPRGTVGHVIIRPERRVAEFVPVEFPRTKAEIERYIVEQALDHAKEIGLNPYLLESTPVQNPENSFDFTLTTGLGEQYLDLMEIAPLEYFKASYEQAPDHYKHGELVDFIYSKIISKSQKYGLSPRSIIHLLLYNTDWRFYVEERALNLLAYYCLCAKHCFKSILYFSPDSKAKGALASVYPRPSEAFNEFNEARQRRRCTAIIDIRDMSESIVFGPISEGS